ncbi:hypothetical protein N7536_001996 [Penicillium majusculum]|uniref:Uncharacterized protein n=1 Tax=Penicillium solitum TaxID=60172 RepID=A0A1V6QS78_9EURO|nr:uncharacterized protein PENSOL_c047G10487 [Penicillium solitum]KAJ5706307.1 hypothetical protein N7536_001996 [Penicillium majusculum]OQD91857.1 hypothetical protein PENSOL_c047G10487 [Penicillium solitum]
MKFFTLIAIAALPALTIAAALSNEEPQCVRNGEVCQSNSDCCDDNCTIIQDGYGQCDKVE